MCGIAGYIGPNPPAGLIDRMLGIMLHRGPDAHGTFNAQGVAIGHTRLSINDLSNDANQPFVAPDRLTAVAVNGEIYNFRELRAMLEQRGCRFKSNSDSEVVLHGYIEFGEDIFCRLNGMFAVAVWDARKNHVILSRDRLGIKPIYVASIKNGFVFASEIKAIAQCDDVALDLDLQSLSEYLVYENCFAGRTLNRKVQMVRPAEIVTLGNTVQRRFYWEPSFLTPRKDSGDIYETYRSLSRQAVERHLISDVPVGTYLSAGIDSSTVTYWSSTILKSRLSTYTGSFGRTDFYDESRDAARLAQTFGCSNETIEISPNDFRENFERISWHLDEPRAGMGSFSQFMVAKRAAQDVKVILTGHGGDEFFAGYPVFRNLLATKQPLKFLSRSTARELILAGCFALYPLMCREASYRMPVVFPPSLWKKILNPDLLAEIESYDASQELASIRGLAGNSAEETTLLYLREYLPSLFNVEDKISMAFSLESRTPLCDNELLDFALSLPLEKKLKDLELKHIPRQSMRGLLPDFIYDLPKKGFPTPLRHWFKAELKPFVQEFILEGARECPLFDARKLEIFTSEILNGTAPYPVDEIRAHRLWVIMSLIAHARLQKRRYAREAY